MRDEGNAGGQKQRAAADRIDIVEMGPLEFDAGRGKAERLVDEEIGRERAQPAHGDDGEDAERLLEQPVDAEFHQQQRNCHIEHQPDDAAGVAVGQAREEVRPGERAGIGVHHVDLELRDHHETGHQQQGGGLVWDHVAEGGEIHVGGIGGLACRNAGGQRQHGEEGARQQLRHAKHHPARAGKEDSKTVVQLSSALRRQEAKEVDLFADLRHQRQDYRRGGPEFDKIEGGGRSDLGIGMTDAGKGAPEIDLVPVQEGDEDEGQDIEHDPEGLRPQLELRDQPYAIGDERDDDQRRDDVADPQGDAEGELQRAGHDRGFDRKQHEGEAGIDQRGDGGADVAEAGAAGQKVDVDAVADRVAADRQADAEHEDGCGDDREEGIGRAIGQRDRAADRLQRQKGDGADGRLRNAAGGELAGALGGEAQGVVLERLVGDPAIILAANRNDALPSGHA